MFCEKKSNRKRLFSEKPLVKGIFLNLSLADKACMVIFVNQITESISTL